MCTSDLMERLRAKHSQRSFVEISKVCRMTLLDKRYALDAVEKANLQKCLDTLQNCIKVTTRLVECIKVTSRQLGLKFTEDSSALFISSDMFYLEIIIDQNGSINDVKVHHECNQMESCKELIACLQKGDFQDFTLQLEGLQSIYQLNADQKSKSKAYPVLRSMEVDLYHLFQAQSFSNPKDLQRVILESNIGMAIERRGGHPMKLVYFVPPYDLLCEESKTMKQLDMELLLSSKTIGVGVTVNLEASNGVKLQIAPTLDFKKGQPTATPLTQNNSTVLPAHFVLRLDKPIPVFDSILHYMNIPAPTDSSPKSTGNLIKMIVDSASKGEISSISRGLQVTLPDQNHCYFFTDARKLKATMVSSIPFTEPLQVPNIISLLRKQTLFQTLISSCVRPHSRFNIDDYNTVVIEVNAASIQQITISFQHPYEESMAMIEIDLRDVANVTCQVYSLSSQYKEISTKLSKVLQVCLSIPVTVRALLKIWEIERSRAIINSQATPGTSRSSNGDFNLGDPGGRSSSSSSNKNGRVFFEGGKSQQKQQSEDFCNSPRILNANEENSGDSNSNSLGGMMNVNPGGVAATTASVQKNSVSITPIPIGTTVVPSISSTATGITITPVNVSKKSSESRRNSVDRESKEKKRKKRRDESPMGPPEKILNLPMSSGPSPKHSPAYTSPKHPLNSPKSPFPGTQSPKHGSSGKPSMSTLKNATNSSPKSSDKSLLNSASSSRPSSLKTADVKIKNASAKLKSMEQSFSLGELTVSSITDDATMQSFQNDLFSGGAANKPKKCSLSAVIDKLKSAQDTTVGGIPGAPGVPGTSQEDNEYMIKPSEDALKITINKTKMGYGTPNSPKKHTGLKPGVNSGPKKFSSSSSTKHAFQKSNSSGSLPSAPISQPTNPADVMKLLQFSTPNGDALMKSFQIPKLSRNNNSTVVNNSSSNQDSKNSIRPTSAPSTPVPTSFKASPNPHSMD